jgi:hypothetical protein
MKQVSGKKTAPKLKPRDIFVNVPSAVAMLGNKAKGVLSSVRNAAEVNLEVLRRRMSAEQQAELLKIYLEGEDEHHNYRYDVDYESSQKDATEVLERIGLDILSIRAVGCKFSRVWSTKAGKGDTLEERVLYAW